MAETTAAAIALNDRRRRFMRRAAQQDQVNRPAATGDRQIEVTCWRVRLNAWLGRIGSSNLWTQPAQQEHSDKEYTRNSHCHCEFHAHARNKNSAIPV